MIRNVSLLTFVSFILCIKTSLCQNRYWIAASSSNWNNTANWSTTSGGSGGATVPGSANAAIFNGNGLGNCTLDVAPTVNSITINGYTGTIDLSGNNLTITATTALTFTTGTITNSGASASISFTTTSTATFNGTTISSNISGTAGTLTFGGGSTFNGTVTMSASNLLLNGTTSSLNTFNGTTTLTKTGIGDDHGTGGNRFNGTTTLANTATSGTFESANSYYDIFNGNLTLNITGGGPIPIADEVPGNQFNGNIILNNTGTADISFCNGTTAASAILAEGKTITAGTFSSGTLNLERFTQGTTVGGTAQTITLTGTAKLVIGEATTNSVTTLPISTFNGAVTFKAPQVFLNGCTYNSTAYLEKTGGTTNNGYGGNVFNGVTTLVNSGSGWLESAVKIADTFNADVTLTNTGSSLISMASATSANKFNGNIIVNSTGSSANTGIKFANNTSAGAATLASGKTIKTGSTGFSIGTLTLQNFTQLGTTSQALTLTGTATLTLGPSSVFNGNVNFVSPRVLLNGSTYNGTAYIEQNGNTNMLGNGGNTFNGVTTLVNSGSGYFATAFISADIFNADVTATNTGSSWVALSDNAVGTQFNGNIIVNSTNSTSSAGITFGNGPGSSMTCTLASGKTISVGSTGFTAGRLRLRGFIQNGSTSQSLTLTGTAQLLVGNLSTFNGNVTFKAPQLYLDGCTYNGTAYLEKTGATNNLATLGANTFNSTATIVNSGSGYLRTNGGNVFNGTTTIANSGSNDIILELTTAGTYNGDVTFTNSGSSVIQTAYTGTNAFNGNIIVNSTAGTGITFCGSTGTATLASTKTITVGGSGFSAGTLTLQRFTQSGATSQAMTFTVTANLTVGPSSTFNGNVTFSSPTLFLNGCNYKGTSSLTKTGSTTDNSNGGNVFTGTSSITNSGSGILRLANVTADNFITHLTAFNNGTGSLELAYNTAGNLFGGNLTLTNTASGSSNTTTSISANSSSTSTITGDLIINHSATGTGTNNCYVANNGAVSVIGNATILNTSSGTNSFVLIAHNNSSASFTVGGNLSITHSGSATTSNECYIANLGSVSVTGSTTLLNNCTNSTSYVRICEGSSTSSASFGGDFTTTSTSSAANSFVHVLKGVATFNGNIVVNNTSTSSGNNGFFIGASGTTGSAILATGKTISVGSTGFSTGTLQLYNFTQNGSTSQNIALTGSANLALGLASLPATFNGDLTFSTATGTATLTSSLFKSNVIGTGSAIIISGNTFSGTTALTKNGTSNNDANGGNTFTGSSTFTTTNTGRWRLGSSAADDYNGAVTFLQNGTGLLQPSYTNASTYAGDISTVGSGNAISFGANGGKVILDGSSAQAWNGDAANKPSVSKLAMQTSGSSLTLGVSLDVSTDLTLTSGKINTTATEILTLTDESVTVTNSTVSSASYIDGPMNYTTNSSTAGSTLFFPIGNGTFSRPVQLTYTHTNTNAVTYTAQNFTGSAAALGFTKPNSITSVSSVRYYKIDRSSVANLTNAQVQIYYDTDDQVTDFATLKIVKSTNNTSPWINIGGIGTANGTGSITSNTFSSFSYFALATGDDPLPIELRFFKASAELNNKVLLAWQTATEKNNDFFTIERSADGETFEPIKKIDGAGNSSLPIDYSSIDTTPLGGVSYYRLKQTDFDGRFSYSRVVAVQVDAPLAHFLYPNPSAGGEFFVMLSEKSNDSAKVTICDAQGMIVHSENLKASDGLIHVAKSGNLVPGFYMVHIQIDEGNRTYKLIVN